ncbi:hypothetical protein QE152_g10884 [Popillia japonica]|uniref:Uncharacterized protein n=1 Tax=Popillia japonica TaxID=7064 RepID=A0AAW1LTB9_POPJA
MNQLSFPNISSIRAPSQTTRQDPATTSKHYRTVGPSQIEFVDFGEERSLYKRKCVKWRGMYNGSTILSGKSVIVTTNGRSKMSSAICQNFVQNAWKKDLCSNCFKSRDEHNQTKPKQTAPPVSHNKTVEGIIKNGGKTKPKRSVEFTKELSEVIGYGGEDWTSDVDEDDNSDEVIGYGGEDWTSDVDEDDNSDDTIPDEDVDHVEGDDEKELQKLTKANTDFNANSLQEVIEVKKSYTQLMLGKPQLDSDGKRRSKRCWCRKETLVENKNANVILTSYTKSEKEEKSLLDEISETLENSKNPIQIISRKKTKSEKEEKSLLDEISETLENSKNPIQIISRKKTEKEVILTNNKPEIIAFNNKENIVDNSKNTLEEVDTKSEKIKSNIPERKNGLTRTTPIIKRDQENKPVVYQTSVAKIELMNTKNLKLSNSKENLTYKPLNLPLKIEKPPKEDPGPIKDVPPKETPRIPTDSSEESTKDSSSSDESLISTSSSCDDNPKEPHTAPTPKIAPTPPQAGEPDGRADPEETEPPALPLTPPPILDPGHTSFLHNKISSEKPKVPSKPATIILRKSPTNIAEPAVVLTSFISDVKPLNEIIKPKLEKTDSNGSDIYKSVGKRKAPQPPAGEDSSPIYTKHPMPAEAIFGRDNKTRKERASSCSPDLANISDNPSINLGASTPEPAPRRSLSLSTDSLSSGTTEEKKKEKRGKFSLKKFLRMGSSKDLPKPTTNEVIKPDEIEVIPQPKPRLVIVHPLELNGAKVEVLTKPVNPIDNVDYCNVIKQNGSPGNYNQRASKPPPPPRNYEELHYTKPNIPHPPKSQEILNKQKEYTNKHGSNKKIETVYANIGEVRSAIVPNKPHRTASMREREAQQQKRANNYEPINVPNGKDSTENVYDYISSARSSSPECDSNKNSPNSKSSRTANGLSQRSESSVDVSGDYFKYQNIPRSMSLTYCGSETESEIYSPYSFCGSETEVAEDDHEWVTHNGRTHKLRSRKGRSIVHKNLEDNYGAVVVANHEALAQVLENIQQNSAIQPALRGLKTASNLCWNDFTIKSSIPPVIIGPRAFHQAVWGTQHVTLVVSTGPAPSSTLSLGIFSLVPVTEFSDLIPVKYVPVKEINDVQHLQATVAVLPWMQVHTFQTYGELLKTKSSQNSDEAWKDTNFILDEAWKDTNFILLQLVNALKTLQAQGIEEIPLSLSTFVLCREIDKDTHSRLYVLQGLGEDLTRKSNDDASGTLCMCATSALRRLQTTAKLSTLLQNLLSNERAVSLSQVKSVLEFSLWGPSDVALGSTFRERELALQRWLDLQRATVLHGLVCTKVHLTVYEECHLLFLVRSNQRFYTASSVPKFISRFTKNVTCCF